MKAPRQPMWAQPLQVPDCPDGWTTAPPDFVGVGAQRCGTSWWFRGAIRAHPRFRRRNKIKEIHYFDRFWVADPPADFAEQYAELFPRPPGTITGEWTPRYMCDPWAMRLLAKAAPDARIMVMLRDPVERYRSGIERETRHADQAGVAPSITMVGDALYRSSYYAQVERVLALYGRSRVLIQQYERCLADPLAEMQRTQRFLGLEPLAEIPRRLAPERSSRPARVDLSPDLRADLTDLLRADVQRLAALCPELELEYWPNFAPGATG